jgi:hypothetical protein
VESGEVWKITENLQSWRIVGIVVLPSPTDFGDFLSTGASHWLPSENMTSMTASFVFLAAHISLDDGESTLISPEASPGSISVSLAGNLRTTVLGLPFGVMRHASVNLTTVFDEAFRT